MKILYKKILLIICFIVLLHKSSLFVGVYAQDVGSGHMSETFEGKVIKIIEERNETRDNWQYFFQKLEILITNGLNEGKTIEVETGDIVLVRQPKFKIGDEVLINSINNPDGENYYYISDYVRRKPMIWLFALFVVLVVLIGRVRGFMSLFGLGISFVVIFTIILPLINKGYDPIPVSLLGAFIIMLSTFYLSHGFNKKTTIALVGTLCALIFTALLAKFFIGLSNLTGYASEEASFLQVAKGGSFNLSGLLLAGIIIGTLGVLDDITISQAAVVEQLRKANPKLNKSKLFSHAMNVGHDHIASLVNTLVLVYTGGALPLLLLFLDSSKSFGEVVNYEPIAQEVIITLIGSIGLVVAVPITTLLAVRLTGKRT